MAVSENPKNYLDGNLELPPQIYEDEVTAVTARREAVGLTPPPNSEEAQPKPAAKDGLVGLALSGGGIRSATFSLGILQALAGAKYLKYVDYLSTVSGGGYIGGSLTWLLSADGGRNTGNCVFGTGDETLPDGKVSHFPYGTGNPAENRRRHKDENLILRHLRLHGKYLTPGRGITLTSLIAVALRGILLNLLVWLPLLTAVMVLVLFGSHAMSLALPEEASWAAIKSSFSTLGDRLNWVTLGKLDRKTLQSGTVGTGLLIAALFAVALFGAACVYYSLAARFSRESGRYSDRRKFESWIRGPLVATATFLVLGSLPYVHGLLGDKIEETGAASLLAGALTGLLSFMRSGQKGEGKVPLGLLVPVGSALFLYGLALTTYSVAFFYFDGTVYRCVLLVFVLIALVTGIWANLNYISLHRYYRDRLMETFMPDPDTDATTGPAMGANKAQLSRMWSAEAAHAPYHLVNTNVVLVDSDNHRFRVRGGDSFLLSPLYCGSTATGWRKTSDYMKKDAMTLPTAVAISGAAANPNAGVGGEGATRNKLLSLLMSLLNLGLGAWVPNPNRDKGRRHGTPNHLRAAYYELSPNGYREEKKFLQISDGGHFEDLAVYELIRRKVKLIICCDADADPDFSFSDLQVLMRRIGADFGARIDFHFKDHLERIIPREPDPEKVLARDPAEDAYPVGVEFAERGYIKGTITYPGETEQGTFIFLKTTMVKGLDLALKGYKGKHPDFPDESTADQFFDEEQFDAYRELGYVIADKMINDQSVDFEGLLAKCASRV